MAVLNDMLPFPTIQAQTPLTVAVAGDVPLTVAVDPSGSVTTDISVANVVAAPATVTSNIAVANVVAASATVASDASFSMRPLWTMQCTAGAPTSIPADVAAVMSILNFRPIGSYRGRFVRRNSGYPGQELLDLGGRVRHMSGRRSALGGFPLKSKTNNRGSSCGRMPESTTGGRSTLGHCLLHSLWISIMLAFP